MTIMVNESLDLEYSPDDRGWYFQGFKNDDSGDTMNFLVRTSQLFKTKEGALEALDSNQLEWKQWN